VGHNKPRPLANATDSELCLVITDNLTFDPPTCLPELTQNWIRSSHGHSTVTLSLKTSCKSVQPFSRNVADKETNKEINKERNRSITIPRPPTGGGVIITRLLVPAVVSGSTTGECSLLLQHFHHRINVAVVTAFTTISSAYWLCAGGLKNNNNDNIYGAVIIAQSHYDSSPGSYDEYGTDPSGRRPSERARRPGLWVRL